MEKAGDHRHGTGHTKGGKDVTGKISANGFNAEFLDSAGCTMSIQVKRNE